MVGNRASNASSPVASSQRSRPPARRIRSAMARLTTSRGASSSTKRSPVGVAEEGPVPAQRLGEQRPGHGRMMQRGRVELHELHVGHRHAGPQGHGQPVGGGLGRVGGHREQLAGPAGGQHGVVGPHLDDPAVGVEGAHTRGSGRPRPAGRGRTTPRARPLALGRVASTRARSTSAPVAAPPAWTTRAIEWPPSRARASAAARLAVEHGAQGDQLLAPGTGPRRPGPAPPRCRTARPRRPGCRPGGDRSSPRRHRARRPRRPGPSGWPTGTARPWSARRPAGPPAPPEPRWPQRRPAARPPTGRPRRCRGPGRRGRRGSRPSAASTSPTASRDGVTRR